MILSCMNTLILRLMVALIFVEGGFATAESNDDESKLSIIRGELSCSFLNNTNRGFLMIDESSLEGRVFFVVSSVPNSKVKIHERVLSLENGIAKISATITCGDSRQVINNVKFVIITVEDLPKNGIIKYDCCKKDFDKVLNIVIERNERVTHQELIDFVKSELQK